MVLQSSDMANNSIFPSFLVIGAPKSGTTSLCSILAQHPSISFSRPKEPRFFSRIENFNKGIDWYKSFFDLNDACFHTGEGSVEYSMCTVWPDTAKRIASYNSNAKILYIVRHPLDRIVSHYRMWKGSEDPNFSNFEKYLTNDPHKKHFVDTSKYLLQIGEYRNYFEDKQILVIFYEKFIKNPMREYSRCLEFLNLKPFPHLDLTKNRRNTSYLNIKIVKQIASIPGYYKLQSFIPRSVKDMIQNWLVKKYASDFPGWAPELYNWICEQICEDAREFLKFYGENDQFWEFK